MHNTGLEPRSGDPSLTVGDAGTSQLGDQAVHPGGTQLAIRSRGRHVSPGGSAPHREVLRPWSAPGALAAPARAAVALTTRDETEEARRELACAVAELPLGPAAHALVCRALAGDPEQCRALAGLIEIARRVGR